MQWERESRVGKVRDIVVGVQFRRRCKKSEIKETKNLSLVLIS
jgi:hypothetical protein